MSTIDGSIVNIALKTLQDDFGVGLHSVEWVVLAYLLALVCLLPISGRLGDMIGKRAVYTAGFIVFTAGSALCGLAWSIETLIGFRVVQAIGAAMIQGVGSALLIEAFPASERGQALGYVGTSVAAGILAGPNIAREVAEGYAAAAVLPGTTLVAVLGAAAMAGVSAALRPPAIIEARFDRRPGER
jgi:MFS family permease